MFLGNHFIKALITKFKRSPEICYGNQSKIKKVLQELGFNNSQIHNVLFSEPTENDNSLYDQIPADRKSNTSTFNNNMCNLNIKPSNLAAARGSKQSDPDKHHSDPHPAKHESVPPVQKHNITQSHYYPSNPPEILTQNVTIENLNGSYSNQ